MPASFPPRSMQRQNDRDSRHNDRESRRSHSGNRNSRDSRVRHQPFDGYQAEQGRYQPEQGRYQQDQGRYREGHQKGNAWITLRGHLLAMFSEFIGTTMFLWFAFAGTQAAAQTTEGGVMDTTRLVFISLSFGISLMVTVWAHYRISGGLFNPAVTLALCVTKNVPWIRGLFLLPAQIIGGIVAAALVSCMLPGDLAVVTTLSEGTSIAQGIFIEAFGTLLLIFVIIMLAAEKHESTPIAPVGIGLALFIAEMACVLYTGGALNPARAFGPSVVTTDFPGHHYIYWIGPIIGALMASAYYAICKANNYEQVNPGQDAKRPQ